MGFIINKLICFDWLVCSSIISDWAVTCVSKAMEHGAATSLVMHQKDSFSISLHAYFWLGTTLQLPLSGVAAALLMAIRNVPTNVADELISTNLVVFNLLYWAPFTFHHGCSNLHTVFTFQYPEFE